MKSITYLFIFIIWGSIFSWVSAYYISNRFGDSSICTITKVDDWDTFDITCWEIYYPDVRLLWVNTPDINSGIEHCFYKEAREYMKKRIWRTYKVNFYWSDLCQDPYKGCRNLVQLVDLEWKYDIWANMILKGFAFSWVNFSIIPWNIQLQYDTLENYAQIHERGLWWSCSVQFWDNTRIDSPIPDKMTL